MFKDRKLAFKQMIGFLLVSAILITVVFVGYRSIGHINTTLQSIIRTIPLVEAAKEIKIAVAQDLQAVMGLVSALDTDELDQVRQVHETYKQRINTYTVAIMEGGETDGGLVYPTQDESLKATVAEVQHYYNTTFEPKLAQIYTLMVRKVSAEPYDYELLETLPEEAKAIGTQLATLLGGVESAAKTAIQSAALEAQRATARANTGLLLAAGIGILVAVALALFITGIMTRPIAEAVRFTEQMADGDLSRTLNIVQKDEIGVLAQALNQMVGSLGTMFREVTNGVHTLTDSSKHLLAISGKMSHNAENTSERSNLVATAAEEMSTNMDSVSAATDQAAGNISRLAAATEKINATMTQISTHSDSARAISQKALTKINAISEAVTTLGTAAVEIDEVTDGIRDISEQVNLLALNATIEAARAGEAGKGFAVVAQEIKALAHQTADATNRADDKLHWIQNRSTDLVASVGDISQFFGEIHTIITDIAEAVEHQSVTTRETAANLAETSTGIQTVNTHVSQSSEVARVIAQDISEVHHTSSDFSDSSAQVDQRAQDLNRLAESLNEMVNRFKL